MTEGADTPFRDENPTYLEGVLKNFIKGKLDLEQNTVDIDPADYLEDYSVPQNESDFTSYIQEFSERYEEDIE